MALIKRSPLETSFLSDFFNDDWFANSARLGRMHMPAVNVKDMEKGYEIELAVPGFAKNDFNISLDDNMLTISAEKKQEKKAEEDNYTRQEFGYEAFSRSFNLPNGISEKDIGARYEDGVLRISIAKKSTEEGRGKKPITVQ